MKTHSKILTAALAVLLTAGIAHAEFARADNALRDSEMAIDNGAPIAATLLPTVSVFADARKPDAPSTFSVAAGVGVPVTLLPTVHVSARAEALAVTQLATVHVVADARSVAPLPTVAVSSGVERALPRWSAADEASGVRNATTAPVRERVMPR